MDERLSAGQTALLAVGALTIALLALTEQFTGLLVAVPTFVAAGWVFRSEERATVDNGRVEGFRQRHG